MTTTTVERPVVPPDLPLRELYWDEERGMWMLGVHWHPGQIRVLESTARFVFMLAGTRGGKTVLGPHWLHREMLRALDKMTDPNKGIGDFWAITTTFPLMHNAVLPEIREVFVDLLKIAHYHAGIKTFELTENLVPNGRLWANGPNGKMFGSIKMCSADALTGLEAAEVKAAWLDEVGQKEFSLDAWEAIQRRLSITQGPVLGTTTIYNIGWMKQEVFDKWRAGDPDYDVIQFDSTENPAFKIAEYERMQKSMPKWKFDMFYRGQYAKPAGLVYDSFDDTHCIVPRKPIPDSWSWYVGHDFGSANPAALFFAYDPGLHQFTVVDEYLPGSKIVTEQVEEFLRITKGRYIARKAGGSHQEDAARENYGMHGWSIAEPSVNNVDVQIARVYALHARNAIMVFDDCKNYINEKMTFSHKLAEGYDVLDEIENESRFHLMACERYILCGFFSDDGHNAAPVTYHRNRF